MLESDPPFWRKSPQKPVPEKVRSRFQSQVQRKQHLKAVRLTLRSVLHTGQGPVFGVAVADTLADGVGARNSGSGEHDSGVGAGLDQVG